MPRTYVKKGGHGGARVKSGRELGKGELFAITLNMVQWNKKEMGEWLIESEWIDKIVVAEEAYKGEVDCITHQYIPRDPPEYHQHIFIKTKESMKFEDIRQVLDLLTDGLGYDLQVCHNVSAWLKYITKEDQFPYYKNVDYTEFSMACKAKQHAVMNYRSANDHVNGSAAFFVNAGNFKRIFQEVAEDHIRELQQVIKKQKVYHGVNSQCKCQTDIVQMFNNGDNIYIRGDPGIGKSELIESLIQPKKVFRAGGLNRFMFGSIRNDVEVILFEDFVWPNSDNPDRDNMMSRILSIMDGKDVPIEKKGKDTYEFIKDHHVQCIFLSNEFIPAGKEMFERRCRHFNLYCPFKDCLQCGGLL
jgi:hypothetical protein